MGDPTRRAAAVALALAGLLLVAGVTFLASKLFSQPIGLASEPATVGASLAPPRQPTRTKPKKTIKAPRTTPPAATTAPATTPAHSTATTTTPYTDDLGGLRDGDD